MINCTIDHLLSKCIQRGYTIEEVQDCIVKKDGDNIVVDENHPSYPRNPKNANTYISSQQSSANGPGTELKKLLSKIGISASPNCSCNRRAEIMNKMGAEWCSENIDTIVGWLKEEANKRKLPFVDMAGRILVKKAISNAKKTLQDN